MSLTIRSLTGRQQELECGDHLTGLILQDPSGQTQQQAMAGVDPAAGADALNMKCSFGTPFIIEILINAEETGGAATGVLTLLAAGGSDVFPVYSSTAAALTTGSPFKFKVIDCFAIALDENTKGTDTLQLMRVAADGTTELAITSAIDMNLDDDVISRPTTIDQDACVIGVTQNLRADVIIDNSTTTDHRAWKCYVTCMRCVADE
jgi:hypothetical protein